MIIDIREYYHNLTKLQKKKFEVLFEDISNENVWGYESNCYAIIMYLRMYSKIQSGKKFNKKKYDTIERIMGENIQSATKLLNENKTQFDRVFEPNNRIPLYSIQDLEYFQSNILDLFQKVLK